MRKEIVTKIFISHLNFHNNNHNEAMAEFAGFKSTQGIDIQ